MSPKNTIEILKKEALEKLKSVRDEKALESFRVLYLGRKGRVPLFLREVGKLPPAERRRVGSEGNALRQILEELVAKKAEELGKKAEKPVRAHFDVSRPGKRIARGHVHILSETLKDIREIFVRMGFAAVEGPEIESEWYNFDALNIPKDHPARDMQDTFWLRGHKEIQDPKSEIEKLWPDLKLADPKRNLLLRTHISGIQMRHMERHQPPFRIYYEGRAFRRDATDATHETQFHQMEVLYVDKGLSVANFKFIIEEFLKSFFKKEVRVRLRPSYFPFVEPGFEIDMTCVRCGGKKCTLCGTGWLEIAGAGMVHPNVFRAAGYAPGEWTGIAFSFGVERLAMLKHKIPDIRLFFGGDMRFIEQF